MKLKLSKQLKWRICIVGAVLFGSLSILFPVEHTNPPVTGRIEAPEKIMVILRRACYDCHSNETTWPWYSYVAPMSWLVSDDVKVGRSHMNFSEWTSYNDRQKKHKRKECGELVEEGEMPLWFYLPLHQEADLSQEDIDLILAWSKSEL